METETIHMDDGTAIDVRPLRDADVPAYLRALPRLSERSRTLRFAGPKPRLTPRELTSLLDVGHDGREAWVALDRESGELVGVARFAPFPREPDAADLAVLVWDGWQGRGIGTALVRRLVADAARHGYRELRATTLGDNRVAQRMLRAGGFSLAAAGGGVTEWTARAQVRTRTAAG